MSTCLLLLLYPTLTSLFLPPCSFIQPTAPAGPLQVSSVLCARNLLRLSTHAKSEDLHAKLEKVLTQKGAFATTLSSWLCARLLHVKDSAALVDFVKRAPGNTQAAQSDAFFQAAVDLMLLTQQALEPVAEALDGIHRLREMVQRLGVLVKAHRPALASTAADAGSSGDAPDIKDFIEEVGPKLNGEGTELHEQLLRLQVSSALCLGFACLPVGVLSVFCGHLCF